MATSHHRLGDPILQALEETDHHHPRGGADEALTDLGDQTTDRQCAVHIDDDTGIARGERDRGLALAKPGRPRPSTHRRLTPTKRAPPLRATVQSFSVRTPRGHRNNSATGTFSALAILTILTSAGFRSPRSIPPR
jgi:hypothetical protein